MEWQSEESDAPFCDPRRSTTAAPCRDSRRANLRRSASATQRRSTTTARTGSWRVRPSRARLCDYMSSTTTAPSARTAARRRSRLPLRLQSQHYYGQVSTAWLWRSARRLCDLASQHHYGASANAVMTDMVRPLLRLRLAAPLRRRLCLAPRLGYGTTSAISVAASQRRGCFASLSAPPELPQWLTCRSTTTVRSVLIQPLATSPLPLRPRVAAPLRRLHLAHRLGGAQCHLCDGGSHHHFGVQRIVTKILRDSTASATSSRSTTMA